MHHSIVFLLACTALLAACTPTNQPAPEPATPASAPATMSDALQPSDTAASTQGESPIADENASMQTWRAFGNEPFWNVRITGEALVFSTPEDQQGRTLQGRRIPSLVGVVYSGFDGGIEFRLDISPGQCSDGMSDNQYEHVATFIHGEVTYRGCAETGN